MGFLVGLFLGVIFGYGLCCIMVISKENDDENYFV